MSIQLLQIDKDLEEVVKLVSSGSKDPESLRRVRQRADDIREEMRKKYGNRDIAVMLVHEARDGE